MRTLMITHYIPYPLYSGAAIRNYNMLKRLSREHEVWVAGFASQEADAKNIAHLRSFCAGVETVEFTDSNALQYPLLALEYFTKGWPTELRHYRSQALIEKIGSLVAKHHFDVVEIEDSFMGLYLEALPISMHRNCLITFHDIVFSKTKRIARLEPRLRRKLRMWLYGLMMERWEPIYMERFGRCIAVSEGDKHLMISRNPRLQIDVVPNGIDTQLFQPIPYQNNSQVLLFIGNMDYRPNIDAISYFCKQILPLIKNEAPLVEVCIAGLNPAPEVLGLAGEGIRVTGTVEDLHPYYAQSAVCIVPLRAGGGTRLKILEAMALGRPVVSTSIGCEGLDVQDGEHLFIADTPGDFANRVLYLLNESAVRESIIRNGRELVVQRYDWDVVAQQLLRIYREVAQ